MDAETLNISLPADMARMVRKQIESGAYASSSEVVQDALRLWQDRHDEHHRRVEAIRAKIEEAAGDTDRVTDDEVEEHFNRRFAEAERKRSA